MLMAEVSLTIDGRKITAQPDQTVLEAATANGIEIPTLCHDPRLVPFGACRLCLVELQGAKGPVTACTTRVSEGMVVNTRTDETVALRKLALEFLLSEHHGDCIGPCQKACPAGIDIQGFIALIARGQPVDALKLIKEALPFPASCGRVCPRFCEDECRRHVVDKPVAICHLKRFAADADLEAEAHYTPFVKPTSGKSVGVVGGGPAGLTAAYYLAQEGHSVTVYESMPKLGGMLRYGIPEYRLPKALLDREIETITALCHEVKCDTRLGKDITMEQLRERHDAVILALGAQACQVVETPGNELSGVWQGLTFLGDVALEKPVKVGKHVAVIGGGNTAIDASRTALRMDAQTVTIYYRRSRKEMPASAEEIEQAEEEGVKFEFLVSHKAISGDGCATTLTLLRMALGEPDASGRRRPRVVEGSDFDVAADTVIWATGQTLDPSGAEDVPVTRGCFIADAASQTPVPGVFAAGDCVTGPTTVVEACGAAHKTAIAVDLYLRGEPVVLPKGPYNIDRGSLDEIDLKEYNDREKIERNEPALLAPEYRRDKWDEIDPGFVDKAALAETARCLSCGCQDVFDCKLRNLATEYEVSERFGTGGYRHPIPDDHPFIVRDSNKCVLCGSCVRICQEVQGVSAWGFVNRGYKTTVRPTLSMPLEESTCESCGQCVSACPTGALTARVPLAKPGPWKTLEVESVCPECSVGCNLRLKVQAGRLVEVTSPVGNSVNDGNLCRKGAFIDHDLTQAKRVTAPLVRKDGRLVEVSWDEALEAAAAGLLDVRGRHGPAALGVWVSPKVTNEEAYLAQKMARVALGTNNVSATEPQSGDALREVFGKNASTATYADIDDSDLVLLFGVDPAEDYPVLGIKLRKAAEAGKCLVTVSHLRTKMDQYARASLALNQAKLTQALEAMLAYVLRYDLTDESVDIDSKWFAELKGLIEHFPLAAVGDSFWMKPEKIFGLLHLYLRARQPLIIVDLDNIGARDLKLISLLAKVTGNDGTCEKYGKGILAMRSTGNAQGIIDSHVDPAEFPADSSARRQETRAMLQKCWELSVPSSPSKTHEQMVEGTGDGSVKGLLVIGDGSLPASMQAAAAAPATPARQQASPASSSLFAVAIAPFMTAALEARASVVLPGATFVESEGTFTNCEGRVQPLFQAVKPLAGKTNLQVIAGLAAKLGQPSGPVSPEHIRNEMALTMPWPGKKAHAAAS